jgi:hypothetical protein
MTTTGWTLIRSVIVAAVAAMGITPVAAQTPPTRTDGWVVLTVDDYRALRARAFPPTPDPLPPPVDATLTRVDYDLRVNGDTVTGEARLTVDVLKLGWVSIQIPAGLLVRGARLEGRPLALVDGNPSRALISRTGRSVLALDIVVPIETAGGLEQLTLPALPAAMSATTLAVPRAGVDLSVSGGFVAEQVEAAAESRWTIHSVPGRPLALSWKRRIDDRRATLPLRVRTRITELVALGEESTLVTASVRVEVVQGLAREAVVAIPDGVTINQVTGATVADWSQASGRLTVTFLEPVTAATSLVVVGETRTPRDGIVAIPILRMPAAERETGGIAVDVMGAGEIVDRQPRGFDPADPADLGDIVEGRESPSMVAFAFTPLAGSATRTLTVGVSRYTPQPVLVANVEEARYEALVAEDGKVLVRARYAVRNNQRAFLALRLPAQAVLWSAMLAGRPVRPGVSQDGAYLLPLLKGRTTESAPTFAVEAVYLQRSAAWTARGDARLELAAVDLPVSRTGLLVHYSPRYEVGPQPGGFRLATDSGPWSVALRGALGMGGVLGLAEAPAPPPPPAAGAAKAIGEADTMQALMARFRRDAGKTAAGTIPIHVAVPGIGPSFFAAAELTAESVAPAIDLQYRRTARQQPEE